MYSEMDEFNIVNYIANSSIKEINGKDYSEYIKEARKIIEDLKNIYREIDLNKENIIEIDKKIENIKSNEEEPDKMVIKMIEKEKSEYIVKERIMLFDINKIYYERMFGLLVKSKIYDELLSHENNSNHTKCIFCYDRENNATHF